MRAAADCTPSLYPSSYFEPNANLTPQSQTCAQVFLIMELLLGGELLDAVLAKGSYSEADARLCFVQLLRGVHYLHSRCALSPDAILLRAVS